MAELQVVIDDDFLYHQQELGARTFIDGTFWARTKEELKFSGVFDGNDEKIISYMGVFTGFDGRDALVSIFRGNRWESRAFDRSVIKECCGVQEGSRVTIHLGRKNGQLIAVADLTPHSEPTYREVPR